MALRSTHVARVLLRGLCDSSSAAVEAPAWSTCREAGLLCSRQLSNTPTLASLTDVLEREISHEEGESQKDSSALDEPPSGWTLDAKQDSAVMHLQRTHDGEQITIKVSTVNTSEAVDESGEADGEGEVTPQYSINFEVDCKKAKDTLRFALDYVEDDTDGPDIEHVAFLPRGKEPEDDDSMYTGVWHSFCSRNAALCTSAVQRMAGNAPKTQLLCNGPGLVPPNMEPTSVRFMLRWDDIHHCCAGIVHCCAVLALRCTAHSCCTCHCAICNEHTLYHHAPL